ncbi:DNA mismatch repair protein MutS [Ceratobasidium sp. AG-Ba]|nr:DNA mismatch repair protein MutS [Ceratobasidium sp. AG-Ba]
MRCALRLRLNPGSYAFSKSRQSAAHSQLLYNDSNNSKPSCETKAYMATVSVADLWSEIKEEEESLLSKNRKNTTGSRATKLTPGAKLTSAAKTKKTTSQMELSSDSSATPAAKKVAKSTRSLPKTKLARDIIENLAKFPHCILLTRVGQFYESYFDQAPEVASLLNIKLAERRWGVRGRIVQMAGFPLSHLDRHLKTLVQTEKRFVALCEEFRKPNAPIAIPGARKGRGFKASPFERRVVRVVTPGTLIDESFVNPYDNNYVCAVVSDDLTGAHIGIAWMDVATGEFFTQLSDPSQLVDDLARISAREIVLDRSLEGPEYVDHPIRKALSDGLTSIAYCDLAAGPATTPLPLSSRPSSTDNITAVSASDAAAEMDAEQAISKPVFAPAETRAIQLISSFLQENLRENMPSLEAPVRVQEDARMHIDAHTVRALEIQKGAQGESTAGSLLSVVRRTVTSSGSRLLSRWLCGPSTSVTEIQARQALVALFHERTHLRRDILALLRQTGDAIRLVQKLQLRRGDADDLLAIAETIGAHAEIVSRLRFEMKVSSKKKHEKDQLSSLSLLLGRVSDLSELAERIGTAVHVTPLVVGEDGLKHELPSAGDPEPDELSPDAKNWSIKAECHKRFNKLKAQEEEMLQRLRVKYSVPTLVLKTAPPHGIFVHISNIRRYGDLLRKSPEFIPLSKSGSTESFFYKPWSQLGTSILESQAEIHQAERNALESLRTEVGGHGVALRRNARIIDEIDVTVGFAELAAEMNFVRPIVNDSLNFLTVNARHPAVELGLLTSGRVFTPNTVDLGSNSRLMVITGPNMAGKSTVLRQSALIAILAQTGSFVPADSAEIGVVDRVFSRIGARDDLFRDRSTFMVEMLEAGEILRRATNRSLVIMDEVGRGTTVRDGLAIAFATAHHLHAHNQCRAMFATHFHEIADMLGYIEPAGLHPHSGSSDLPVFQCTRPHISFFCTDIAISPNSSDFSYVHRLRPGVNRESHGLRVAQLGGMPDAALDVARQVVERLKGGDMNVQEVPGLGETGVGLGLGLGLGVGSKAMMRKIGDGF